MYYLDSDYRVHVTCGEGMTPWEDITGYFAGKCRAYIEGYRVIPEGESWTDSQGRVYEGMMIAPTVSYDQLRAAQEAFERELAL